MTYDNTILGRCCAASAGRLELLGPFDDPTIECTAAILGRLSDELEVLYRQDPLMSLHDLSGLLRHEAMSVEPAPLVTWANHPALTVEERNS
jgi:hypothetical protein